MKRRKVLIVTTVPETITSILAGQPRHLNRFFEIHISTSPENTQKLIEQNESIKPHYVKMSRGISPTRDLVSVISMIALISKIKPDAIHSYTPKAGLVSMLAAWVCRVPIRIHTFTGLIFPTQSGLKQKVLMWIDRLICACATTVIPEGAGVKNDLKQYNITKKNLEIIGYGNIAGVDTSFFSKKSANLNSLPFHHPVPAQYNDNFIFCFIGRLNRDKGISELAEAFSMLPEKARLFLVGGLDKTAPVATETLEYLYNNPRVHIFGHLTDIRPALINSHVLVLPSYREGFPNVVLQAGSMQLPAIVTDINGCNEIIEQKINGWLVKPKNCASLYSAMLEAMSSPPEILELMGRSARSKVKKKFERSDHWVRMVEFYQSQFGLTNEPDEKNKVKANSASIEAD